ncbi:hypothetical protein [Microbulbifer guangxiensis]|uniref:hypothetical protein n=1 Tax=Microbulbifer guangxiensis TaxID=2904249 RepID=UPI001F3034BD|nr:hypothetical protein [Microbulbifer guangxiensis]
MGREREARTGKLFLDYRRTFESGDAQQVADFYRFPLHYYAEDGAKSVVNRLDFVRHVEKLLRFYRRLGVRQIVGTVTDQLPLNAGSSLVSLNWTLLRSEAEKPVELYTATTRYLVTDGPDGLQIDALFAVDETARLRRALRAPH